LEPILTTTSRRRRRQLLDLAVNLDRSLRNQALQVHAALRAAIVDGLLEPGLKLPSSRSLADQLGVQRNTIVSAYEHLASDGLIDAHHGSGTYVAERLPAQPAAGRSVPIRVATPRREPFELGHTHVDRSILHRLASISRKRIASATEDELGYGDPRGSAHLRIQIARHLAASRGVRCDPECIIIVSGTQHAIRLCADALLAPGDRIWIEDPGYYATHATLRAAGMRLVPVRVDAEGLDVEHGARAAGAAKAVCVTPSHQFPTGVSMTMRRRIALTDWARASRAWIIEDDYDSEFRYDGPPLTALAGLGSDRVLYIGTFTKILFASLRLAYAILPASVIERTIAARATHDRFPPRFMQDAVADLIADGTLAAHIRRVRSRYRKLRDEVITSLRETAGEALDFRVPDQGLHILARLPPGHPKDAARHIRQMAAVEAKLLSETGLAHRGPDGFILGFSGHDVDDLRAAARRLGSAARNYLAMTASRSSVRN
jgi:GntR family transcriptional regulator/MocR family aminotransferase